MKDNYSWLDDCLGDYNGYDFCGEKNCNGQLKANELKRTIISQIEIEKLRARITEAELYSADFDGTIMVKNGKFYLTIEQRIADLTEKLKELEG